jgi:hypothetical protein
MAYILIQKVMWGKASKELYASSYDKLGKWVVDYLSAFKTQKANRGDRQERKRDVEIAELLKRWTLQDLSLGPRFSGVYVAKTETNTVKVGKAGGADSEKTIAERISKYNICSSVVTFESLLSYDPDKEASFLELFHPWRIKKDKGGTELFTDCPELRKEIDKHVISPIV